ncbi:MAG: class I SAM-dependent methyltransferase [Desulfarculus sp.]|nr:MAG: class I SAM-dependent methyltransferase [Desulfarculus sp.]
MDYVFEAAEAAQYENWLETRAGQLYLRTSTELLDRVLDYHPGWRVLDVGCGLGLHLQHLLRKGLLVHGLEAGPVMARLAATRLGSKVEVELGDAHDLPFEDNSFDAVILVNTLEFTDRRAQVLAEAARVASSRVCLVGFNPFSPLTWRYKWPRGRHPFSQARPLAPWSLLRLVREVLGPVPRTWAASPPWPGGGLLRWPLGSLVAVCAAVTPRYRTQPLTVEAATGRRRVAQPVAGHSRVSLLHRVK